MSDSTSWILLARLLRPQGRKGEVLADLFTAAPEQFGTLHEVWLAPSGYVESEGWMQPETPQPKAVSTQSHWLPLGKNAGRIVLHFTGIDSIEKAEALTGREVVIPASQRPELEDDAVYVSDLVGATVFDGDCSIGTIAGVEFPTSPDGTRRLDEAPALLEVRTPHGDEVLVPFVRAFIQHMDLAAGILRMRLPEGLVDINRSVDKPTAQTPDS